MKKVNRKRRFMTFYVLVLLVLGLSVILVTVKITNKKVLAKSNEIIQDALERVADDEKELKIKAIFDNELNEGYKNIFLSTEQKKEINDKILNTGIINYMIESKEYSEDELFRFDNGEFTDGERLEIIYYSINDADVSFSDLNKKSYSIFDKYIDKSNVSTLYDNDKILLNINTIHNDYILKARALYYNETNDTYDLYLDSIYPYDLEQVDNYKSASKLDYTEIIHIYRLRVKNIGGTYKYISLDMCDYDL